MFTKLAQLNVDHFNNHPKVHLTITVVYALGAAVVIDKMTKKLGGADTAP